MMIYVGDMPAWNLWEPDCSHLRFLPSKLLSLSKRNSLRGLPEQLLLEKRQPVLSFLPCRDLREPHDVAMRLMQLIVLSLPQPHILFIVGFRILLEFPHKSMRVELFCGILRKYYNKQLSTLPNWLSWLLQLNPVIQLHQLLLPQTGPTLLNLLRSWIHGQLNNKSLRYMPKWMLFLPQLNCGLR